MTAAEKDLEAKINKAYTEYREALYLHRMYENGDEEMLKHELEIAKKATVWITLKTMGRQNADS